MDYFTGPTFTIEDSSPPVYLIAPPPPSLLFHLEDQGSDEEGNGSVSSASSSSIGEPGDSDEEDEDEASSDEPLRRGLSSLEDSLPVKKGLSNHFSGKSKSFVNLAESSTATAKDLEKVENPINKKRRVLIACKWSKKSSFYGWHQNPKSMPLFPLVEEDTPRQASPSSPPSSSSDRDEERPVAGRELHRSVSKLQGRRSFKAASCFALSDLVRLDDDHDHHIDG